MANLIIKSSADNLVLQGSDASPAITVGATGTTTFAENATLSGTANNLGTVTAGTISTGATIASGVHGKLVLEEADHFVYETQTDSCATSQDQVNISGANYLTVTPGATTDKLEFGWRMNIRTDGATQIYFGLGIDSGTATNAITTRQWASGRHTWGSGAVASDQYDTFAGHHMVTAADWSLSASTTYYFKMVGQTHSVNMSAKAQWGYQGGFDLRQGVEFNVKRWRVL